VSETTPVLALKNVSRRIGEKIILDNVSFDFFPGNHYTLLGPSGAGKTSLLRLLNRLDEPTGGKVYFCGKEHCDHDIGQLRRSVGYLFQRSHMFPGTVRDNLVYANSDLAEDTMRNLLTRSAISEQFLETPTANLSGGEAQRVALARLLATDPSVVLLDEPTSALDPTATAIVEKSIRSLAQEQDLTIIMVSHDPAQALRIGGEVLLMVKGRILEHGPSETVVNHPSTEEGRRYRDRELQ
jgi:putative ABC transport system ATP-binding protein